MVPSVSGQLHHIHDRLTTSHNTASYEVRAVRQPISKKHKSRGGRVDSADLSYLCCFAAFADCASSITKLDRQAL